MQHELVGGAQVVQIVEPRWLFAARRLSHRDPVPILEVFPKHGGQSVRRTGITFREAALRERLMAAEELPEHPPLRRALLVSHAPVSTLGGVAGDGQGRRIATQRKTGEVLVMEHAEVGVVRVQRLR